MALQEAISNLENTEGVSGVARLSDTQKRVDDALSCLTLHHLADRPVLRSAGFYRHIQSDEYQSGGTEPGNRHGGGAGILSRGDG